MAQQRGPEHDEQRPTTVDTLSVTAIRPPMPDGEPATPDDLPPKRGRSASKLSKPPPQPGDTAVEDTTDTADSEGRTAPTVPALRHVPKHGAKEPDQNTPGRLAPGKHADVPRSRLEGFERLRVWLRRPAGRAVVAGSVIALMLGVAYSSGRFLVPSVSTPQAGTSPGSPPAAAPVETGQAPVPQPPTSTFSRPAGTSERPSDALAAWAGPRAVKLEIPPVAMQAYGYAELITARTTPRCKLTWTTLAGIAKIESDHGRFNGALLQQDGKSVPPIIGLPLNGQSNRKAIADTDTGAIDTDRIWDRAVGPMQFLPSTWKQFGTDADADGVTDVNDIDDASMSAATYLCANGRDLSTVEGWNAAIRAYNVPQEYRTAVFNATNDYGRRDRTG